MRSNPAKLDLYRPEVFNHQSRYRFERERWDGLLRQLNREPTAAEKILINRIIATEWLVLKTEDSDDPQIQRNRLLAEDKLRNLLLAFNSLKPGAGSPSSIFDIINSSAEPA